MEPVKRRVVIHFPGFERMDAQAHHRRFKRSAQRSAEVWGFSTAIDPLSEAAGVPHFAAVCEAQGWRTASTIYLCDHNGLVEKFSDKPIFQRILAGFASFGSVIVQGGLAAYFRHAWRFGLFFLFPFLLMSIGLAGSLAVAALPLWLGFPPWHYLWSLPLAWAFYRYVLLPFSERYLTLHLFADWELAASAARIDGPDLTRWLERQCNTMIEALEEPADEYVISSHSMGSTLAAHVLGMVLERKPDAIAGKRVVFITLGGAILQCALLKLASRLRQRVGAIARAPEVSFLEVQCLTDVIHFYRSAVVSLCGHHDAPQAELMFIRVKHLLAPERYRRIKRDFLRVHRQYVLHADVRGSFDFTLLTTGPFPADLTTDYSKRDFGGFADALLFEKTKL
ncbi:hypothetical protein [Pararhizobium sp.]|uniref:hypothetical protein n=1 Tax=Pararhizobium sp. TaxID=1977563 RepID=UPI003D0E2BBB